MKRILINATHNEEIRVALCKGNHLYDFDLENRTREQKKSNIYKGHVTRVEPSLEAVFVEYGSQRQGFLPIREIANEYLKGNARDENIRKLIKEGDELIVQVEKEERGNKGAALSTYVSLAGRYLVLMPNNPRGGGISRQISGKLREDMKRMLGNLDLPKGMSVIIRTAGIGKTQEDLQHDLNHLLNIWEAIQEQNKKYPSPRLVHQEAGVVTRAVRDYLRDDIAEIWIDNENAYVEAAGFIEAVMPTQADKLRKYTDFEPMFARFGIEKQIETAYQREVRLPSGGSIVIDQTEALVSIDINSAKSTKGSDVAETAYHTNLEAADEIARQLRLRDMGGLIVIDFIDMNDSKHQKDVEKRLVDATKYDRARVQFGDISRFGLMEMSRQRLRPSLEESTGYICPRCHGNGMIRDLRSLSLSIMRQIEQIALKERQGEVQAEVPTDIAAFLLNEKRDSLVYLEQDSGTRITILPHAHLDSPNFKLHFNRDGFAPSSYERITDTQQQEFSELGYDVDWQTADKERPEQQPTRQPRQVKTTPPAPTQVVQQVASNTIRAEKTVQQSLTAPSPAAVTTAPAATAAQPKAVAWLSNLFAPTPQASTVDSISSQAAAEAIEAIVNSGAQSLGALGQVDPTVLAKQAASSSPAEASSVASVSAPTSAATSQKDDDDEDEQDKRRRKSRKPRPSKPRPRRDKREETSPADDDQDGSSATESKSTSSTEQRPRRPSNSRRDSRGEMPRGDTLTPQSSNKSNGGQSDDNRQDRSTSSRRSDTNRRRNETSNKSQNPNEVSLQVNEAPVRHKEQEVVHLSLDDSKTKKSDDEKSASRHSDAKSDASAKQAAESTVDKSPKPSDSKVTARSDRPADPASASEPTVESESKHESKHESKPELESESQAESVKGQSNQSSHADDAKGDSNKINVQPDQSKENSDTPNQHPSDDVINTDKAVSDSVPPETESEVKGQAEDSQQVAEKTNSKVSSNVADHDPAITPAYDAETLFADRYIAAKKFGLASNDPRAVLAKQAQAASTTDTPTADTAVRSTVTAPMKRIQGTVGEFIHSVLPEAAATLRDKGVIASFIEAVHAFHETTDAEKSQSNDKVAKVEADKATNTVTNTDLSKVDLSNFNFSNFNFSNYGYEPLDESYLGRFNRMTQAVRQIAIAQGKTDVSPRPVTKRASNDPRGPHPDYQAPAVEVESGVKAHTVEATALTSEPHVSNVASESESLLIEDAEVIQHLNEASVSKTPEKQNQSASQSANLENEGSSDQTTDVTQSEANDASQDHAKTSEADTSNAESATSTSEQSSEQQGEGSSHDTSASENSSSTANEPATPSKTTIASYKNMIENVAEQLLPQQSNLFNLTTPKVPKARSRKSKTEHKKPTQAEKQSEASATSNHKEDASDNAE